MGDPAAEHSEDSGFDHDGASSDVLDPGPDQQQEKRVQADVEPPAVQKSVSENLPDFPGQYFLAAQSERLKPPPRWLAILPAHHRQLQLDSLNQRHPGPASRRTSELAEIPRGIGKWSTVRSHDGAFGMI